MNVGDVVELKSGGPVMTVVDVQQASGRTIVSCTWMSNRRQYETQAFPIEAFVAVPADDIRLGSN